MNFARNEMAVIAALLFQQFELKLRSPKVHIFCINGAKHPSPAWVTYQIKAAV